MKPEWKNRQASNFNKVRKTLKEVLEKHGYKEIIPNIVEHEQLLQKGLSDEYHYSQKETFRLVPRTPESPALVLRPEGTTSVVRHHLAYPKPRQPLKVYYLIPMFRREQPQRGRLRQFYQAGIENLSSPLPSLLNDFETLKLSYLFLSRLEISSNLTLNLNCIGSQETRKRFSACLMSYFSDKNVQCLLSPLSLSRLSRGAPLRILDSSNPGDTTASKGAPSISSFLSSSEKQEFLQLQSLLKEAGIPFVINERLVRGLEYYNGLCFEWIDFDGMSAMGGGRYDSLGEALAGSEGKGVKGVGWGAGFERLSLLMNKEGKEEKTEKKIGVIVLLPKGLASKNPNESQNELNGTGEVGDEGTGENPDEIRGEIDERLIKKTAEILSYQDQIIQKLESKGGLCEVFTCLSKKHLGKSFNDALKKGIEHVVIIGEDETRERTAQVKDLARRESQKVDFEDFSKNESFFSF